ATKCCARRYIEATRYAVSASLENGRWKRAIGRNTAVRGQPLLAMIRPINEYNACCADRVAVTDRSSLSTVTRTVSYDTKSAKPSMTPERCSAAGQCNASAACNGQPSH